jgi:hypothetical protein
MVTGTKYKTKYFLFFSHTNLKVVKHHILRIKYEDLLKMFIELTIQVDLVTCLVVSKK